MVHASGAIMLLMSSIWIGATVTIVPAFDAGAVLDTWAQCGATIYMGLPTLIRALLAEQRARPRLISTGRLAICGGDAVPVPLQEEYAALFGHRIVEGFGMTEGLPTILNLPDANRPGTMGRAMGDAELRVVDGELWMRGSGITPGYWGETPFEDGWLKTGDLVSIDGDGYVWFRGRKKEIIIRGGSNLSPQEIEEAIYKHPAVAEVGVIGEPDSYWGGSGGGVCRAARGPCCERSRGCYLRAAAPGRLQGSRTYRVSTRAPEGCHGQGSAAGAQGIVSPTGPDSVGILIVK